MSDVNELDALTGEVVLRPYTEKELALIQGTAGIPKASEISPDTQGYAEALQTLAELGITESQIRSNTET